MIIYILNNYIKKSIVSTWDIQRGLRAFKENNPMYDKDSSFHEGKMAAYIEIKKMIKEVKEKRD